MSLKNVHLPQSGKIAGGPSEYLGPANKDLEDRTYGHWSGTVIQNPNDVGGSARDGRNGLPIRETVASGTGSVLYPRSTVGR